jgi:type I restriction enzyme S subunit
MTSRKGWRRAKFGEIAENVTVRVDDPSQAGVARYVGLEHLDPGSILISRWGRPTDVEATKLRFWPGDIIFGRRRAYQRKLAVADFEGICSAHALVLRAKPDVALPEFLPFFMQSDAFHDRALAISVGSLSPTINWKTLREQEFDLPPIDEQRNIAELCWAVHHVVKARSAELEASRAAKSALVEQRLDADDGVEVEFSRLWSQSPESGCSAPPVDEETGHFVLSLAALTPSGYRPNQLKGVTPTKEMLAARLFKGDLLISRSNTKEMVGLAALYPEDSADVSFPDTMMRLSVDPERALPEFIETLLMSPRARRQIQRVAAGTSASMKKINRRTLGMLRVVVPSISAQRALIDELDEWRSAEGAIVESCKRAQAVAAQLREAFLS